MASISESYSFSQYITVIIIPAGGVDDQAAGASTQPAQPESPHQSSHKASSVGREIGFVFTISIASKSDPAESREEIGFVFAILPASKSGQPESREEIGFVFAISIATKSGPAESREEIGFVFTISIASKSDPAESREEIGFVFAISTQ
jgi:hypothetical protein